MIANLPLPLLVAVLIGLALPHLAALLSQQHWSEGVTGVITLALAALDGLAVELAQAGASDFDWSQALTKALFAFLAAVASRYGVLTGTKLNGQLRAIGSKNMHADANQPPA